MLDMPDRSSGDRLEQAEYRADFRERFWSIRQGDNWKLERQQTFAEPGDPSWEAFTRGDWDLALDIITQQRPSLEEERRRMRASGIASYRVRVVAPPLTPYLQWELHAIRWTGTDITSTCRRFITELYETGEDIASYFHREVAPLPPPTPGR